jgi:hypothetical protein
VKTKPGSVEAEVMSGAEVNVTIFDWAVALAEVETLQVAVFEESVRIEISQDLDLSNLHRRKIES